MESFQQKKHLFVSLRNSKMKVDAVDQATGRKWRCLFANGIYQTNSDDEAKALQESRYHGMLFKKEGNLVVTDPWGDDLPLYNKFNRYSIRELRKIASEKEVAGGRRLQQMKKEELIHAMIDKKVKLGEYATV